MFCAKCWSLVGAHDRACMACGADLTAPGSVRMTDPRRYASPDDRPEVDLSQGEDAVSDKKETTRPKDAKPQAVASQQTKPPVPRTPAPQNPAPPQAATPVPRFLTPEEAATIARIQAESAAKQTADQASAEDQDTPEQQAVAEKPEKKADSTQQDAPGPKNDPDSETGPTQKHPTQSQDDVRGLAPKEGSTSQQTGKSVEQAGGTKSGTEQAGSKQTKNKPDSPQPQGDGADEPTVVVADEANEPTHPVVKPAEGPDTSSVKDAATAKSEKHQVGEPKTAENAAGKPTAPSADSTRAAVSAPQGQGAGHEERDGKPAGKQAAEPTKVDPVPAAPQNQNIGHQNQGTAPQGRRRKRNRDRKKAKPSAQGWPAPPPSAAHPIPEAPAVPATPVPSAPATPMAASISQPAPAPQAPAAPLPPQTVTPAGPNQTDSTSPAPEQDDSPQPVPASSQAPAPQNETPSQPEDAGANQSSAAQNQGVKQHAASSQPVAGTADRTSQESRPISAPQPAQPAVQTQQVRVSQPRNPQTAPSPASSPSGPTGSAEPVATEVAPTEEAKGPGWWGGMKTHISELGAKAAALNAPAVEDDEDAGESFNFWSEVGVYEPSEEETIAREYDPRRRKALYWLGGGIVFVVLVSILFTLGMFSSERKLYASVTSTSTAELPPNPQPSVEQSQGQPTSTEETNAEQSASASSTPTPSTLRTPKGMVPGAKQCADGVWAGPNTSCNLAAAAAQQIDRSITKPVEISAFSSTTNRNYRLQCTPNEGITCEGLDGVSGVIIYIAA